MGCRSLRHNSFVSIAILGCWIGAIGCGCQRAERDTATLFQPASVEYAGCAVVSLGPTCTLKPDRKLTLWVDTGAMEHIELAPGAKIVEGSGALVQLGQRFAVVVSPGTKQISLVVNEGEQPRRWQLALAETKPVTWLDRAAELQSEGKFADASRLLNEKLPTLSGVQLGRALSRLARIELRQGKIPEAEALFKRSIAQHDKTGRISAQIEDATALAHTYMTRNGRFVEAELTLSAIEKKAELYSLARLFLLNSQGGLARFVGDVGREIDRFAASANLALRLDQTRIYCICIRELALTYARLGRYAEAEEILRQALKRVETPYPRARLLHAQAWTGLLRLEAGQQKSSDPASRLREALAIYEKLNAPATLRFNLYLDLALAALHAGDKAQPIAWLARAEPLMDKADLYGRFWAVDLNARVAMQQGKYLSALTAYRNLEQLAEAAYTPQYIWRALVGQAEVWAAQGRSDRALACLQRAVGQLDEAAHRIPLGEGRSFFVAQKERAARLHVELLIGKGDPAGAMRLARHARAQVMRSLFDAHRLVGLTPSKRSKWTASLERYWRIRRDLEQEAANDWQLPADEVGQIKERRKLVRQQLLRELNHALELIAPDEGIELGGANWRKPRPNELWLLYYPGLNGWFGFADDGRQIVARPVGPLAEGAVPSALSEQLLAPFESVIAAKEKIVVLGYGALNHVDFHALPFGGGPLIAAKQVVYSLDLPSTQPPTTHAPSPGPALFVINPTGDLPQSEREIAQISPAQRAQSGGRPSTVLTGSRATAEALHHHFKNASSFHFSGHTATEHTGVWQRVLQLTQGDRLSQGDILALNRVPEKIVLLGCETGRLEGINVPSLALGQTFIVAGSKSAIVATRPLADRTAALFSSLYYDGSSTNQTTEARMRRSLNGMIKRAPKSDWSALRLVVP